VANFYKIFATVDFIYYIFLIVIVLSPLTCHLSDLTQLLVHPGRATDRGTLPRAPRRVGPRRRSQV